MSLHQRRTHPVPVDGCWACKLGPGPFVAPSATPTRSGAELHVAKNEERNLTVDGEAYKRLRRDGFQPKSINGSAHLEANATTRFEIESGQVYKPGEVKAALGQFEDTFGHSATTPVTTPTPTGNDAA